MCVCVWDGDGGDTEADAVTQIKLGVVSPMNTEPCSKTGNKYSEVGINAAIFTVSVLYWSTDKYSIDCLLHQFQIQMEVFSTRTVENLF